ncbi:MAG: glycosyl transferase [Lachnospiraceae bacterium]|nr:glycosyl transferase [Lachnospiraceae bacterium]
MIGTELLKGQGLGNQLFCYITTRCIAMDNHLPFSILGSETVANNIHSDCGMYFMELDYGVPSSKEDYRQVYYEKEDRIYMGNSRHDLTHGCYVTGVDEKLMHPEDNTLLYGNMQAESYYIKYKEEIRQWLKVKEEYDCMEYSRDNLCILHLRCSDYLDCPELYLRKKYWKDGIRNMKKINPDMEFMIITNDVKEASKILPGIPAYNFDLAKDYSIIKNAKYLLLSNSSFAYFPAFTSTTVKYILAPKYWARHNVSDGYWASEQNIYEGWHYQDRSGKVFTYEECLEELQEYKNKSPLYRTLNKKPEGATLLLEEMKTKIRYGRHWMLRILRSIKRRLKLMLKRKA